jgi:hypothetical protein
MRVFNFQVRAKLNQTSLNDLNAVKNGGWISGEGQTFGRLFNVINDGRESGNACLPSLAWIFENSAPKGVRAKNSIREASSTLAGQQIRLLVP